jgi:hypothetical protein
VLLAVLDQQLPDEAVVKSSIERVEAADAALERLRRGDPPVPT